VPKLLKDGHIDRAYLGLASGDSPAEPGALVGTVNPGTAAADAGIKKGDVIVGFDGKTIRSPSELSLDVLKKQPGDSVKVELKRGNSTHTVTVKLGRRPNQASQ
jgi:S1-C subfamily serine protease